MILTIFCPPAGAVAGVALASADMYSAAVGKDWMTGRELDATERGLRAGFALFDLVPGVGYVTDLAKTGKLASKTALKTSLKETLQEGVEQGFRNIDNFKTVLKNVDDFGKRVVTKIDDFGKQTTEILRSIRDEAYQLADGVFNPNFGKHTAKVYMPSSQIDEGIEASRRFTLNGGGSKIRVPNGLTQVDLDMITKEFVQDNVKPRYSPNPEKWLKKGGKIEIDSSKIPPDWIYTDWDGNRIVYKGGFPDFKEAGFVKQEVEIGEFVTRNKDFRKANKISRKQPENTWHHFQDGKTLQEVPTKVHSRFTHEGGFGLRKKGKK